MKQQILDLEKIAIQLAPNPNQRAEWTGKVTQFAFEFIDQLPESKAFHVDINVGDKLNNPIQATESITEILDHLSSDVLSLGLNPASGGHLGYIPGGGIYGGALGDYLAAVTNQYAGIFYGGPGAVKMENELIRWMCHLMGYPAGSLGNLTSGGSIANLIAIVTAREARQITCIQIPKQCIYLTSQVHHCVHKAIRISGMSEALIRLIPMDESYKMSCQALEEQIKLDMNAGFTPFLVVASAGTTDTGAVDPLNEIADLAEQYNIWYHVDAAYGGFFIMSELKAHDNKSMKDLFKGIERSDSIAIDPHKGLFLSYGLGAVLIKDVASQYKAHYYKAAYMQDTLTSQEELSPADLSPELTKHFRGLRLWVPLKLHGIEPFKACLDEKLLLCRYFYQKVQELGFLVGPYPDLSVCIYRYIQPNEDPSKTNQKIVEYVLKDGRLFVSSTTIDGVFWIRIAILSFRTHLREIDMYLQILKDALFKVVA